ncbi:MAG: hypothetical protein WA102_12045 [Candidatus Methanoperedens sp.]
MTVEIKAPEKIKKGGVLEGTVIITLDKDVKFRDVIISFDNTITYLNPCKKNFSGWNLVSVSQQYLNKGGRLRNAMIPFEFSIPREAPPSYKGKYIESIWQVNVKIDIPLSFDIHAEKYVEVER